MIRTSFGIDFTHPSSTKRQLRYEATMFHKETSTHHDREPKTILFTAPDDTAAVIKATELLGQEPDEICELGGIQQRYF